METERRKGLWCAAVPRAPVVGRSALADPAPPLRSPRAAREALTFTLQSTPRLAAFESPVQSRQSPVSRRAQRTSVTSPRETYQPCGEVKLSNVIHFRIPVLFGFSGLLYF